MNKLLPLSGVLAVIAILVAFSVGGETPDADASVNDVVSFYTDHDSDQQVAGSLLALASVLFLIFTSVLAGALRKAQGDSGGAAAILYAGGIVFATGLAIFAGLSFALGDVGPDIDPSAVQALHVLNEDLFYPAAVGVVTFLLGGAIGILKTGVLPAWLGWLAVLGAVIGVTPIGFFALAVLGLFTLISSVMLAMRADTV